MTRVVCACGLLCASRSGFATHARRCTVEQARSDAFVAAVQAGLSGPAVHAAGDLAAREEALRLLTPTLVARSEIEVLEVEHRRWAVDPATWAWDVCDSLPGIECASCGRLDSSHGPEALDGDACRCGSENTTRVLLDPHDRVLS